eukprot:6079984-Prymnesium_polylepis.1
MPIRRASLHGPGAHGDRHTIMRSGHRSHAQMQPSKCADGTAQTRAAQHAHSVGPVRSCSSTGDAGHREGPLQAAGGAPAAAAAPI